MRMEPPNGRTRATGSLQWAWLLTACALTCGCINPNRLDEITPKPHVVQRFDEAGSVHLAVLSSIPFPRMESELQPRFKIDEAKALEEVIPNTQLLTERVLDVVERSLRLTTPQTFHTETEQRTSGPDLHTVETTERTETEQPGAVPGAAPVPGGARTASGLPTGTAPTLSDRAIDPFTKYKAATALLQEIRLLSQYVVAQQLPPNTKAQVVRLQISVLPYARAQPYDVYSNISFFPEENQPDGRSTRLLSLENDSAQKGVALVIPLLATDNFEASSQTMSAEAAQQAALSLLGLVKGFGIGADYGRLLDQLRSVSGRDLNALLTVSKLTTNTLRVRMGAPFSTRTANAMVPQNYHVSAVVVVPEATTRVNVLARSTLRHAMSGKALEARPRPEVLKQGCELLNGYGERLPGNPAMNTRCEDLDMRDPAQKDTIDRIFKVLTMVEQSEFATFQCTLLNKAESLCKANRQTTAFTNDENDVVAAAWASLVELVAGSHLSRAWFGLSSPMWPPAQYAIANDDGKTLTATVSGGRDLPKDLLSVELKGAGSVPLVPTSLTVQDGAVVKAVFPSLKLLNLKPSDGGMDLVLTSNALTIHPRAWPGLALNSPATEKYKILYQEKKPEPESKPKLSVTVSAIAVDSKGIASIQLAVKDHPGTDLYLSIAGGELNDVTPASALKRTAKGWLTSKDEPWPKLTLNNVREGHDVTFQLIGADGSKVDEVRLDVWALPGPKGASAAGSP